MAGNRLAQYCVDVPEGTRNNWRIERFEVTPEQEFSQLVWKTITGLPRYAPAGWYTRLVEETKDGPTTWMSDTPDEIAAHLIFMSAARGDVLITGLGLGIVVQGCFDNPMVKTVTVIEQSRDVIALTGLHYRRRYGRRFKAVEANAFEWQPKHGQMYDAVWHDIWPEIDKANIAEMDELEIRYRQWLMPDGIMACWERSSCEEMDELFDRAIERSRKLAVLSQQLLEGGSQSD